MSKKKKKTSNKSKRGWVTVANKGYGNALKGTRIYFEGGRPPNLRDDGAIGFGKNILEALKAKFTGKFKLILTPDKNEIRKKGKAIEVRISIKSLGQMNSEKFSRDREVKNDIIDRKFFQLFPQHFTAGSTVPYVPGTLGKILGSGVSKKLSSKDKEALNGFLPEYIQSEAVSAVILKASTQIKNLKDLAADLKNEIDSAHPESWWQSYIQNKILLIQQGYIRAIEKMNTGMGNTKYPDFALITHDNYLDILEIKKPDTLILKSDPSRGNFYWDAEVSRAVIQLENYLNNVSNHAADIRSYILDKYKIDLKVVRPRGIILVGDARKLTDQKQKDDLRLLSQGLKNITIVTYDELYTRLNNYITVLEGFGAKPKKKGMKAKKKTKKKK